MRYFPDEPAEGAWSKCAVAILPLFYLSSPSSIPPILRRGAVMSIPNPPMP